MSERPRRRIRHVITIEVHEWHNASYVLEELALILAEDDSMSSRVRIGAGRSSTWTCDTHVDESITADSYREALTRYLEEQRQRRSK